MSRLFSNNFSERVVKQLQFSTNVRVNGCTPSYDPRFEFLAAPSEHRLPDQVPRRSVVQVSSRLLTCSRTGRSSLAPPRRQRRPAARYWLHTTRTPRRRTYTDRPPVSRESSDPVAVRQRACRTAMARVRPPPGHPQSGLTGSVRSRAHSSLSRPATTLRRRSRLDPRGVPVERRLPRSACRGNDRRHPLEARSPPHDNWLHGVDYPEPPGALAHRCPGGCSCRRTHRDPLLRRLKDAPPAGTRTRAADLPRRDNQ